MIRRSVWAGIIAFALGGCSQVNSLLVGTDNALPPTELGTIEATVNPQARWQAQVGDGSDQQTLALVPAVAGNRVFAASYDGVVVAFDTATGSTVWQAATGLPISAGVGLSADLVLFGTEEGEVVALDRGTGNPIWQVPVPSEVLAVPKVDEGVVVVRTIDGSFTGLDVADGNRLWLYAQPVPALTLRGLAAPVLARGVAIAGLDTGKLMVLSLSDGRLVWDRTVAPPRGRTELDRLVDIDAEPQLIDNALYVSAYQGNVAAIDLQTGETEWRHELSSHAGLDVDDQRVYVTDDDDVIWALDRNSGEVLWQQDALKGRRLTAPVIVNGTVVAGDFEGYLHWLQREDGQLAGRLRVDKTAITVKPVVADDSVYVLNQNGTLSAVRIDED